MLFSLILFKRGRPSQSADAFDHEKIGKQIVTDYAWIDQQILKTRTAHSVVFLRQQNTARPLRSGVWALFTWARVPRSHAWRSSCLFGVLNTPVTQN